jgi:hypothetical protein
MEMKMDGILSSILSHFLHFLAWISATFVPQY